MIITNDFYTYYKNWVIYGKPSNYTTLSLYENDDIVLQKNKCVTRHARAGVFGDNKTLYMSVIQYIQSNHLSTKDYNSCLFYETVLWFIRRTYPHWKEIHVSMAEYVHTLIENKELIGYYTLRKYSK